MAIRREQGTSIKKGKDKGKVPYSVDLYDGGKIGIFANSKRGALLKARNWEKSKFNINKVKLLV